MFISLFLHLFFFNLLLNENSRAIKSSFSKNNKHQQTIVL